MPANQWLVNQLSCPTGWTGWLLSGIWNRRNRALNDFALTALDLSPDDRVLEVGFGGGYLLQRMSRRLSAGSVAGIDHSPALVSGARSRFRTQIRAGNMDISSATAESIPYSNEHFNKAVSVNAIFYWKDIPRALSELHRVLVPCGRLVICCTEKRCLEQSGFGGHNLSLLDEWDIRYLLQRANFCVTVTARAKDAHREFVCLQAFKRPPKKPH